MAGFSRKQTLTSERAKSPLAEGNPRMPMFLVIVLHYIIFLRPPSAAAEAGRAPRAPDAHRAAPAVAGALAGGRSRGRQLGARALQLTSLGDSNNTVRGYC